jgi:hypothetical protein
MLIITVIFFLPYSSLAAQFEEGLEELEDDIAHEGN